MFKHRTPTAPVEEIEPESEDEPQRWSDRHPILSVLIMYVTVITFVGAIVVGLFTAFPPPPPNLDPRQGPVLYGVVDGEEVYMECEGPDLWFSTNSHYIGDDSGPMDARWDDPACAD